MLNISLRGKIKRAAQAVERKGATLPRSLG
jgi:hypothetical protein